MTAASPSALRNTVVGMAAAICVVVLFVGLVPVSKYGSRSRRFDNDPSGAH